MGNSILKSVSFENYASFADHTEFTIEATQAKEYPNNLFKEGDSQYNKVSFLYGANGSGKTLFCRAIREIQRLLLLSPLAIANTSSLLKIPEIKEMNTPVKTFAFDREYQDRPTHFSIDIVLDGITYHYAFAIQGKTVVSELLTKKYRRTEKLLERTSPSFKDIVLRSDLKNFEFTKNVVKEEALCLPVAGILNNSLASRIVEAIKGIQVVNMTAGTLDPINPEHTFSEERIKRYISIIQKADPTIRDIKVSYQEEEIAHQKAEIDDFENREFIAKRVQVGVDTKHAVFDHGEEVCSAPIAFFADESLGTIKLFTALPYLFDTLESGGTLVIDELENGLHLSLAKEVVGLFMNSETNPHNAQLICTSHQPLLVDGEFRRDQVWVASKDSVGKSSLYRFSELKTPRAKTNLVNRILEGAFGCNPGLFFKNNT